MENDLISVIIPVYNTERYISRCLKSVLNNTYRNIEVICVDDGSTDGSLSELKKFEDMDERVRVITKKNGGVSAARNRGIAEAKGEWISFVDSDDWIHCQFFELLAKMQKNTVADVAGCSVQVVNDEVDMESITTIKNYRLVTHEEILNDSAARYLKRNVVGKIYRKTLIGNNRFWVGQKIAEDTAFNVNVLFQKEDLRYVTTDVPMYFYFMRDESSAHTSPHSQMFRVVKNVYLPNLMKYPQKQKNMILEQSIRTLLSARYLSMYDVGKREIYKECNYMLEKCLGEITTLSASKRIIYQSFRRVPFLYRVWRIVNDPTMMTWEKNQKKLYCQRKQQGA